MHLKKYLSAIFILLISNQVLAICEAEIEDTVSAYPDICLFERRGSNSDTSDCRNINQIRLTFTANMNRILNGQITSYDYEEPGLTDYINKLTSNPEHGAAPNPSAKRYRIAHNRYEICALKEYRNKINKSSSVVAQSNSTSSQSQNQAQQAQQILQTMQQAQQQAQQNQQRADQARQGKRKTHAPDAVAHDCIEVDTKSLYGGFKNKCSYPVSYGYCVNNPRKGAWTDSTIFSCAGMAAGKPTAGGQSISANGYDVNHTKGGDAIYYFACKKPAYAMDLTVVIGQGIQGRCGTIGGN